jgi:hypothetical protein
MLKHTDSGLSIHGPKSSGSHHGQNGQVDSSHKFMLLGPKGLQPDFRNPALAPRKIILCVLFVRKNSLFTNNGKERTWNWMLSLSPARSVTINCALLFFNKGQLGPL